MSNQVNNVIPFISYTAAASATTFAYNWWINEAATLEVYVDGVLISADDYTVSGVQNATGGNVVFDTPLTGGEIVVLRSDIDFKRLTAFQTSGSFRATAINLELSTLTSGLLQLERDIQRCLRISDTSTINPAHLFLGSTSLTANRGIKVNAAGNGLELTDGDPDQAGTSATAAAASATAAAASATAADASATAADASADAAAASATTASNAVAVVRNDFVSFLIPEVENKDYRLVVKAPYAGTITETTTRSASVPLAASVR